ncbi:hypothetical protein RND81_06G043600 [Saponaria officinalis]|uniref:Uncharacterized protein n=1 Tax=Saponaria officinalis TaxID=3572 RepID=A0AAW1K7N0_SAPOF
MASTSSSTLKLIIKKGPRSGETLEFHSRSTIRLGPVVRGNNLTFDLNLGKWIITNLDSSNVGETTLIRVWIVEFGEIGGKLLDSREEVRVMVGKEIENRANGGKNVNLGEEVRDSDGNDEDWEMEDRKGQGRGRVRGRGRGPGRGRGSGRGKPKKVSVVEESNVEDVEGTVEGGMKTRRTRSSRNEVEEFVSLEMPVRRTRSSKIMEDVTVREVEEGSKVDGVVDNKRIRGGRGRKKTTDVKELYEAIDSVRDDTRESLSEGVMDDVPQQNVVKEKQRSDEPACTSTQQNEQEDEMNEGFLGETVYELVEGSLFAREQPCAESMFDTVQLGEGDMLEVEAEAEDALSLNQKTILELFAEVDQESEPKDEANIDVLEVEACENVDDRAPQDEIMVGDEKQTPDKFKSDLASEDQIMVESVFGEISKETNTGYRGGIIEREPVPAPDLEKMTMGEWFDYLEAYLPKQIYDVTDEIIDDMRKRAKQFDAFMLEQQQ